MIVYTLKQDDDGQWSIRCQGSILARGLPLDSAIEQAHELAHTERMDSGRPTCVDLTSAGTHIPVADKVSRPPVPLGQPIGDLAWARQLICAPL